MTETLRRGYPGMKVPSRLLPDLDAKRCTLVECISCIAQNHIYGFANDHMLISLATSHGVETSTAGECLHAEERDLASGAAFSILACQEL